MTIDVLFTMFRIEDYIGDVHPILEDEETDELTEAEKTK